jgi:hypothetical protein
MWRLERRDSFFSTRSAAGHSSPELERSGAAWTAAASSSDSFDDAERALRWHDPGQLQPRWFEKRGKLHFGALAPSPRISDIAISRSFPNAGLFPGAMTLSTTSTFPFSFMAARQFRKFTQWSSSQSWMMCFIMYASRPFGTDWKMSPASRAFGE